MFEKNEFLALSSLLPSLNDLKNNNISLEENTNLINSVIDNLCYKFNDILFIKTIGDETLDKVIIKQYLINILIFIYITILDKTKYFRTI